MEIIAKEKEAKAGHILKKLVGKLVRLDCSDLDLILDTSGSVKLLEVNDEWIRIEYVRTRENSLFKKENVIKLIELSAVNGFALVEEEA